MFVIVNGGGVVYGPTPWDRQGLSAELYARGVNVSLPFSAITQKLEFDGATLYPAVESKPAIDASYQRYSGIQETIRTDDVLLTYTVKMSALDSSSTV